MHSAINFERRQLWRMNHRSRRAAVSFAWWRVTAFKPSETQIAKFSLSVSAGNGVYTWVLRGYFGLSVSRTPHMLGVQLDTTADKVNG